MKKKHIIVSALTAVSMLLASCGTADIIPADIPVTLTFEWWGKDIRNNYTVTAVKKYTQMNPNVEIKNEFSELEVTQKRMFTKMATNNEADVMQVYYEWFIRFADNGEGFYDLETLSDIIDLSVFSKDELAYGTVNGKLLGLPISLNAETFYYNKDIYDKYGLDLPQRWNDLFEAAKVMSRDGVYPLEMDKTSAWLACVAHQEQLTGYHCYDYAGVLTFSEEDFCEMLRFYKKLIDEKAMKHYTETGKNDFLNGVSAGALYWISNAAYYCQPLINKGINVVIGDYICDSGSMILGWHAKPTALYCIKNDTLQPQEAAKFVNYLVNSQEMAQLQGTEKGIPLSRAMLEVLESEKTLSGIQYEANNKLAYTKEIDRISPYIEDPDLLDAFDRAVASMLYDGAEPEELAHGIYEAAQNASSPPKKSLNN